MEIIFIKQMYHTSDLNSEIWYLNCLGLRFPSLPLLLAGWKIEAYENFSCKSADLERGDATGLFRQG